MVPPSATPSLHRTERDADAETALHVLRARTNLELDPVAKHHPKLGRPENIGTTSSSSTDGTSSNGTPALHAHPPLAVLRCSIYRNKCRRRMITAGRPAAAAYGATGCRWP